MQIRIGKIGTSDTWRIQMTGTNVVGGSATFERGSKSAAEQLGVQLAGGQRGRIRWQDFPADAVAAAEPGEDDDDEGEGGGVTYAVAELVDGRAADAIDAIETGKWDDLLDAVEVAEKARDGGPRVTVTRAIDARRG